MAANTKALPRMDMSISGALRTQFMMTIVPGVELSSLNDGLPIRCCVCRYCSSSINVQLEKNT